MFNFLKSYNKFKFAKRTISQYINPTYDMKEMDENGNMEIVYFIETYFRDDNPDEPNDDQDRWRKSVNDPLEAMNSIQSKALEIIKSGLNLPKGLKILRTSALEVQCLVDFMHIKAL